MLATVLTYRGGCTGTNNGLFNVEQRSETPQVQVLCTSTSKILGLVEIIDIIQYETSGRVAHLLDSSLFSNVFMKDSNNASQRLMTIEHSASYVTFVCLQVSYCIFGLCHLILTLVTVFVCYFDKNIFLMLKTVLTYRGGCTGTNNGLFNVEQRSETPQAQVLCTSTSKMPGLF
ncbi:hypothetical protein D917_08268 [Trichinella nativa]|uniref:Uncharacterized protein n=1 Tax=Trichinella nativa TaxID=6335 RepID=A0A1Y3ELV6_9BILA|nr:hypothetical protein D917_08268 [Trichinella nativa]